MTSIRLIVLIFIILYSTYVFSQRVGSDKGMDLKETEKLAEVSLQEGKFEKALTLYQKLLNDNQQSPLLNFLVGYCYLNTDFGLEQSIAYLKNAVELPATKSEEKIPIETYYYLATAYQKNYQFDDAINILNELLGKTKSAEINYILPRANEMLRYAQDGLMLNQTSANISIENLVEINSKYSDRNELSDSKSGKIIFTSRRENPMLRKKLEDGQYDENIYASVKTEDNWDQPFGISSSINTAEHESTCWLSEKGDQLLFDRFDKNGGSLYLVSKKENGDWGIPEKLNSPINIGTATTFGSFSPDGKYLYYTSERKGGYGGTDIYVAEYYGNNKWGPAKNLGNRINTALNEESPFINENGVFFFSSEGHLSMGGFDIFLSIPDESGNWSKPVNLGIPINSTSNDFFYRPSLDGQSASLSSDRSESKGKSDLFYVDYSDSLMKASALISGILLFPDTFQQIQKVEIKVRNNKDNANLRIIKPNAKGEYSFYLPSDESYTLEFCYQNVAFYLATLIVSKSYSVTNDQIIFIKDINLNPGQVYLKEKIQNVNYNSVVKENETVKSAYFLKLKLKNAGNTEIDVTDMDSNVDSVFSIRITISESALPLDSFEGLSDIKQMKDQNKKFVYYIGEYVYEWEALVRLKKIQENYPDAVVFRNQKSK